MPAGATVGHVTEKFDRAQVEGVGQWWRLQNKYRYLGRGGWAEISHSGLMGWDH